MNMAIATELNWTELTVCVRAVRARVVELAAERRTVEGRTLISSCDVVGVPEPSIEWRRTDRPRPYVLGVQPVRITELL